MPIPPPNLQLAGAGGQGVDWSVRSGWGLAANELTPYDGSGDVYDGGNGQTDVNAPVYKAQAPAASVTVTPTATAPTATSAGKGLRDVNWAGVGFGVFAIAAFVL